MADEGKLRKQADRGERAKKVLENPLTREAFEAIEKEIEDGWKNSRADDEQGRHNAYLMHRLLQRFREQFTLIVNNGEHARKQLLDMETEVNHGGK